VLLIIAIHDESDGLSGIQKVITAIIIVIFGFVGTTKIIPFKVLSKSFLYSLIHVCFASYEARGELTGQQDSELCVLYHFIERILM
jgi:hypothetical protein